MSSHRVRSLSGWGGTAPSVADRLIEPTDAAGLAAALGRAGPRGAIARGLGRSYGDPAQNAGGTVIDATAVAGLVDLDLKQGRVTVLAGTSLESLMEWLVPLGWFVPVTPGTRQVTVGGAIASDIHGKNHHRVGSWCDAVEAITLVTPADGIRTVTPVDDPDLFWATAGGMGLTGVIIDATFRLHRIETSYLLVDTDRTPDLDTTLDLMESGDHLYDYSVAWVDITATGGAAGRSILDRGRFAHLDELDAKRRREPLRFRRSTLATAPPVMPGGLINPLTVRAFNQAWYHKAPRRRRDFLQTITGFFHPLDLVEGWNKIYGRPGFLQWQCALPLTATEDLRAIVAELSARGTPSFLSVLKRFGPGNAGHLSFPIEGWTLTVDVATTSPGLAEDLDRLDRRVAEAGGRLYLAKDSRMSPELVPAMYPRLDRWRAVRDRADPDRVLVSDLSRRLHLQG